MNLKEEAPYSGEPEGVTFGACKNSMYRTSENGLDCDVFQRTDNDNKLAPSIEDTAFLRIMDSEVYRDEGNSWVAPLPFRAPRQVLPNNREQALNRFHSLQCTLKKKPEMEQQFVTFMNKLLENDHAEPAPPLKEGEECWFLPIFVVYHPKKPDQIGVREDHRNFLRFLWFRDSDPTKDVIEYRMKVYVFGNSPSPAVAIYGLRQAASEIAGDTFTYEVSSVNKPFTKRGVLSSVNSIFDPLGMVSLVTIQGRALLRELSNYTSDWDALLPEETRQEWETWRDSPQDLKQLHIPQTYISVSYSEAKLSSRPEQWFYVPAELNPADQPRDHYSFPNLSHSCRKSRKSYELVCPEHDIKLYGKMEEQVMADLLPERLNINPPFTYVGLDIFRPWMVRATTGGHAESKRWAILFTCMNVRAAHIEVIESMDASSCINALRQSLPYEDPQSS
ncbi:Dystrophin-1 [Labeo rohita]|uniref:Dystrophin-1 n=1 Tax=Labeo rohita TaxID=84645 RepID=A0ABQ8MHG0_LABRO|nr:Dystrophin-1 [Labeo rohita]